MLMDFFVISYFRVFVIGFEFEHDCVTPIGFRLLYVSVVKIAFPKPSELMTPVRAF